MRLSELMVAAVAVAWGGGVVWALTPEETFKWKNYSSGVKIIGVTPAGKELRELVIPETLDGKPVVALEYSSLSYIDNVETIRVPGSLGKLDSAIIAYCPNLRELALGEGITATTLPPSGCPALERIVLPSTLSTLAISTYYERGKFPKLGFAVAEGNVRFRATADGALIGPDSYGKDACVLMFGPPSAEAYTYIVPEGVERIGSRAFAGDVQLTAVTLAESCGVIGPYAFDACTSLTRLTVTDALWHCGERSLRGCSALEGLRLPKGFRTYGPAAFEGCRSMNIDVDEGNANFRSYRGGLIEVFSNTLTLTHAPARVEEGIYYVPEWVVSIGTEAFLDRVGITSVVLPASLTRIERKAFDGCDATLYFLGGKPSEVDSSAFTGGPSGNRTGWYLPEYRESWTGVSFAGLTLREGTADGVPPEPVLPEEPPEVSVTLPEDIAGDDAVAAWVQAAVKATGLTGSVIVTWAEGTTPETLATARLLGVVPAVRPIADGELLRRAGDETRVEVAAAASLRVSGMRIAAEESVTLTVTVTAEAGTLAAEWAPVGAVSVPSAETLTGPFSEGEPVTLDDVSRHSDTEGTWTVTMPLTRARFFRVRVAE